MAVCRYRDPDNVIRKPMLTPVPAYENCIECQTLQDLEAIRHNQNALHMESLAIRERILGRQNPEVPQPVIFRGAVFADIARFDRCIELWLHALNLRQLNHASIVNDLLRFAQVRVLNLSLDVLLLIGLWISTDILPDVIYRSGVTVRTCEGRSCGFRNRNLKESRETRESWTERWRWTDCGTNFYHIRWVCFFMKRGYI